MGMYSVGMKTSKDASNTSYVSVAMEEVVGLFSLIVKRPHWDIENEEAYPPDLVEYVDNLTSDIPDTKPTEDLDMKNVDWELLKGNIYYPDNPSSDYKGVYAHIQKTNTERPDFTCYIRVWKEIVDREIAVSSGDPVSLNRKLHIEVVWGHESYQNIKLLGDFKKFTLSFNEENP